MKFLYIACVVAVQVYLAVGKPTGAATEAGLPSFEEFISQAQSSLKSVSEHVNEMIGLPKNADASSVLDVLKTNTENWTKEVSNLVEKLKKQVDTAKTGELSTTLKSIQEKFEKTAESLKKEIESPEVAAKTKQIQESFTKSLNVIVDEANKLSKSAAPDSDLGKELEKLSKQIVEEAVKAGDQLQDSLHHATGHAKDHAGHKH